MDRTTLLVLLGLAGVAGIAMFATAEGTDDEQDPVRAARDALFTVGPNCDSISWKLDAITGAQQDPVILLNTARAYYLEPKIREALDKGINTPKGITTFILDDLFPECVGRFPPKDVFSSHNLVYLTMAAWVTTVLEELGLLVTDPVTPPATQPPAQPPAQPPSTQLPTVPAPPTNPNLPSSPAQIPPAPQSPPTNPNLPSLPAQPPPATEI